MQTAQELIDILRYSLEEQKEDFRELQGLQRTYDNRINKASWPTQSMIPTAQHFTMVEDALGPALDGLFPETNGLQFVATDPDIDDEAVRNAEFALWSHVTYSMNLRAASLRSLKDCFKCGVGYGRVEPFMYTPETEVEIVRGGKRTRIVTSGEERVSIRYRYFSPGKVVPYPDGTDFDGPEAVPYFFLHDPMRPWEMEALLSGESSLPGIAKEEFQMSYKEITDYIGTEHSFRGNAFYGYADGLGGRRETYSGRGRGLPLDRIPIVKVFIRPGTEVWLLMRDWMHGEVLLYREQEGTHAMSSGMVKWSAWPDGDKWFPMCTAKADQKRGIAYDLFLNFFFDMMTRAKDAQRVVNKSALAPGQRHLPAGEDIYIDSGDARTAVAYLESPRVDPSIPAVGQLLEEVRSRIQGRSDFTAKNFTRGGTMAFSDLMGTMQARERLAGIILETTGLQRTYELVLAGLRETTAQPTEFMHTAYDESTGRMAVRRRMISPEDLNHGYKIVLDTSERRMLGGMSDQLRLETWKLWQDRPDVRLHEVHRVYPMPDMVIRRVFKPREELDRLQREDRQLQIAEGLGGAEAVNAAGAASAAGAGGPSGAMPGAEAVAEDTGMGGMA